MKQLRGKGEGEGKWKREKETDLELFQRYMGGGGQRGKVQGNTLPVLERNKRQCACICLFLLKETCNG